MIKRLKHKLKQAMYYAIHPTKMILRMADHGHFKWIPDKQYLQMVYRLTFHERLDLANPKGYNEKLNWIKLYDRKPEYRDFVDKIEVRRIVTEKIGDKYLIPMLFQCDNTEEIRWDELPKQFVLKCAHGSHSNIICKDKNNLDISLAIKLIKKWQKKSWYWFAREWPYKGLRPRIMIEKYMEQSDSKILTDYKVMCFDGEPRIIEVHKNRGQDNHSQDFYDCDWHNLKIRQGDLLITEGDPAPAQLQEMLSLSRVLAKGIIHIRVDWYIIDNRLYFGELTFFDGAGFTEFLDKKDDIYLGSYISIPQKENNKNRRQK